MAGTSGAKSEGRGCWREGGPHFSSLPAAAAPASTPAAAPTIAATTVIRTVRVWSVITGRDRSRRARRQHSRAVAGRRRRVEAESARPGGGHGAAHRRGTKAQIGRWRNLVRCRLQETMHQPLVQVPTSTIVPLGISVMTSLSVPGVFRRLTSDTTVAGFADATPADSEARMTALAAKTRKVHGFPHCSMRLRPTVRSNPNPQMRFNPKFVKSKSLCRATTWGPARVPGW